MMVIMGDTDDDHDNNDDDKNNDNDGRGGGGGGDSERLNSIFFSVAPAATVWAVCNKYSWNCSLSGFCCSSVAVAITVADADGSCRGGFGVDSGDTAVAVNLAVDSSIQKKNEWLHH